MRAPEAGAFFVGEQASGPYAVVVRNTATGKWTELRDSAGRMVLTTPEQAQTIVQQLAVDGKQAMSLDMTRELEEQRGRTEAGQRAPQRCV